MAEWKSAVVECYKNNIHSIRWGFACSKCKNFEQVKAGYCSKCGSCMENADQTERLKL